MVINFLLDISHIKRMIVLLVNNKNDRMKSKFTSELMEAFLFNLIQLLLYRFRTVY